MESKVDEIIQCVAGTQHRSDILRTIFEGTRDFRAISDELDIPRATLRHNLGKLIDMDLVESTVGNEYRVTPLGEATISGLTVFREPLEIATRLNPFLSRTDYEEFDVPLPALRDAKLKASTRANPFAPSRRVEDVLRSKSVLTCHLPIFPSSLGSDGQATVPFNGVHFAAPPDVLSGLADRNESAFTDLIERNRVFQTANSNEASLGLLLTDTEAIALVLDENQKPHALVEDNSEPFCEWVDDTLEKIFSDASHIDDPESIVTETQQYQTN